ncbi:aminoacyl--tRNA ligase-related protein [Kitasatospora sp. NPDC048545]|uniref:aminoacyl--tRNA ligase-related protein n=1 Tax=Kitasatospora sp. NPDC048545 TaxID=3157208 RepID=UPI0033F3869A
MTIELALPTPLPEDVRDTLRRHLYWVAPHIAGVTVLDRREGSCLVVDYRGTRPTEEVAAALRAALAEIVDGAHGFQPRVVAEHTARHGSPSPSEDPFAELVARRWICEEAPGSFTYRGLVAQLFEALDRAFRRRLEPFLPSDVILPALVSPTTLLRSGSLTAAPHTAHFVFHIDEDLRAPARFAGECVRQDRLDLGTMPGTANSPEAVLSTAACQPFYRTLADQVLSSSVTVTGRTSCFRYESGATESLRRLREFTVREMVVVGTAEEVATVHARLLRCLADLLTEMEIDGRLMTAADPFFVDTFSRMRRYQLAMEVKHELVGTLPFDGSELAVASVNHHGEHFGRAWRIRTDDGGWASSCCLGLGLDRWVYAVFSQHGTDPARWPLRLRALVGDVDAA